MEDRAFRIPALVGLVCLLLMLYLLEGCASNGYWEQTHSPYPVRRVIYVEHPCGRTDIDGCAHYESGTVQIKIGLRENLRACVEAHERKHFAGFTHPNIGGFSTDCGDGTMVNP